MKKHNIIKVVLVTMLIFMLLTWILPAAYYSGEYVNQGRMQMGLFDLFNYPLTALSYFGYIALFVILVGGFYGILYKIPAYRIFLDKIVETMRGSEKIVLSAFVIINAFIVSICGFQFGLALFIPFIVSIILLMGYDKMVAAFVTVGSICAGLIGTTYASSNISILTTSFSLNYDYEVGIRFVILAVSVVLVIFNMLMYIKKNEAEIKIEKKTIKKAEESVEKVEKIEATVEKKKVISNKTTTKKTTSKGSKNSGKNTVSKSKKKNNNKAALKDEDIIVVKETVVKNDEFVPHPVNIEKTTLPITIIFGLMFILFILAFIPWGESGFGVKLFEDATKAFQEMKIFGFPLFAKLFGTINSFGNWTITDMFLPMALVIALLMIIYRVKFDEAFDGFKKGVRVALTPASIVLLVYSILVLVTYHPFQLTIYKFILGWSKGFNVATTAIVAIFAGLFNSDATYSFQSIAPYYVSVVNDIKTYATSGIIFQSMYGLTMFIAPTSLVLMGVLSYLGISYRSWLKNIWKLLVELFAILFIIFIILAL